MGLSVAVTKHGYLSTYVIMSTRLRSIQQVDEWPFNELPLSPKQPRQPNHLRALSRLRCFAEQHSDRKRFMLQP